MALQTSIITNCDVREVKVTATDGQQTSDMIATLGTKATRGILRGPANSFYPPLVMNGNLSKGSFLNANEKSLAEALKAILSH